MSSDKPASSIPIQISSAMRTRVRCKTDHADPWLRGLYLVWAALPVPKKAPEPPPATPGAAPPPAPPPDKPAPEAPKEPEFEPQVYAVKRSNELGDLLELWTEDGESKPGKAIPLFPGVAYDMYFVRYPSESFAVQLTQELNEDFAAAVKKYGKPQRVVPERVVTGVDKKTKATIEESVIKVGHKPELFLPQGSTFYKGWLLFRDMPGTGANQVITDIQCAPLLEEVRRLQFHLGRLRYITGSHFHPYSPEPAESIHREDDAGRYPNEGLFDVVLWNAVLRFQRDARTGKALQLTGARVPTLSAGTFDPLPGALDPQVEIADSLNYLTAVPLDRKASETAPAAIPVFVDTLIEKETGDAIRKWLQKEWRFPGKILVAKPNWVDWKAWVHQDVYAAVLDLERELTTYGAIMPAAGLLINNGFRDTRMSVYKALSGQAIYSIHKSGFALDMISDAFVGPNRNQPLYFEKAPPQPDGAVRWTVWCVVPDAKVETEDLPDHIEYRDSIQPWKYDSGSPEGGSAMPPFGLPGHKFLNFTKICNSLQLKNISAHTTGWQSKGFEEFTLMGSQEFQDFVNLLQAAINNGNAALSRATINGASYELLALKGFAGELRKWLDATAPSSPLPLIAIQPWTKEGRKQIERLRARNMTGFILHTYVEGYWTGGRTSDGFPEPEDVTMTPADPFGFCEEPPGPTEGTIELFGKETDFPDRHTFTVTPDFSIFLEYGSNVKVPLLGHPAHMEWWHFQYVPGYEGKRWVDILEEIGWTEEGLLGKEGNKPIFGLYGMGYKPGDGSRKQGQGIYMRAT